MPRHLKQRSTEDELMDSEIVEYAEFRQCLRQLEWINIFTLAYRPTHAWFKNEVAANAPNPVLKFFDVGSGGGDMVRRLAKWATKHEIRTSLVGIDLNPWSKRAAEELTLKREYIQFEVANIFAFKCESLPDFIISSLFTHHLRDHDLIKFIRWMNDTARQGWFINDLHRHVMPYYFIKAVTHLIPVNRLIRHDASVSVARAFTRSDWLRLLKAADISPQQVSIKWFFPFRYGIVCRKK